jgi:hypothetical protein
MQKIQLPKLYPAQSMVKHNANRHRFTVVASARRWGKSILGLDLIITKALETGNDTAFISISYKQLLSMFDMACSILGNIAKIDRANKRIRLPQGNSITFWSADTNIADKIRGQKYQHITIDEAAFLPGLKDIFHMVLRPTLVDLLGSAIFISTPNGYNDFYQLYNEHKRNPYLWYSYRATSYDNPYLDRNELDDLKIHLPERVYQQEILAHFLESNYGVFTNISALFDDIKVVDGPTVIGIDFARSNDNTAMTVMQGTNVIDLRVYNDMSFERQIDTTIELYKQYKPEVIIIEKNGLSEPLVEQLTNSGLPISPFHTTNESKKIIVENLAVAIEQRTITVDKNLRHTQQLADELSTYESRRSKTGLITYNAGGNNHDDMVMALALAYKGIREDDINLVLW